MVKMRRDIKNLPSRQLKVAFSPDAKEIKAEQALTACRAKGGLISWLKVSQEVQYSQSVEPRVSLISGLERVPKTAATHSLQSQG